MAAPNLSRFRIVSNVTTSNIFIDKRPTLPPDVVKRFPSLKEYENKEKEWLRNLTFSIQGGGI